LIKTIKKKIKYKDLVKNIKLLLEIVQLNIIKMQIIKNKI